MAGLPKKPQLLAQRRWAAWHLCSSAMILRGFEFKEDLILGFSFSLKEEKGKSKNIRRRRRKRENNMRCGEEKKEMNEEMKEGIGMC